VEEKTCHPRGGGPQEVASKKKSLKLLGVTFYSRFSFVEHAEIVTSKAKKAASAIDRLGDVCRGITSRTMK
jgi:hypothetical protein